MQIGEIYSIVDLGERLQTLNQFIGDYYRDRDLSYEIITTWGSDGDGSRIVDRLFYFLPSERYYTWQQVLEEDLVAYIASQHRHGLILWPNRHFSHRKTP